jgi:catechol 2,3-dioxygenase-like lactoylglutathione lyase family enzyme
MPNSRAAIIRRAVVTTAVVAAGLKTRAFASGLFRPRFLVNTLRQAFLVAAITLPLANPATPQQPPQRPRIFGIAEVQIFSSNASASHDFYSRILGTAKIPCDWCESIPGNAFSLNASQIVELRPAPSPAPSNLIAEIVFLTDSIPALRKYLQFHKIAIVADDNDKERLTLTDPEGQRLAFVQRRKFAPRDLPDSNSGLQMIHAGFVVHDRAAQDRFYKDILGFRLYWHGGMQAGADDWVDMQVPDGTQWIEYMLNVPSDANQHTLGVMDHMAIGVPDIRAAYLRLVANGWKPTEQPKIGRDGKWQLNLYDPDDTRVEFMEFTPTEKPCCSPYVGPHPGPPQPDPPATLKISRLTNPQSAAPAQPQL